ncbi:MAG: hypothetical protein NC548_53560 [Lachnospiraceae bacterium]|nr:hypothetical protein [Lachnospiraceae bacterium]
MKKSTICYVVYVIIGLLFSFIANYSLKELEILGQSYDVGLWMLASLVLIATSLSFWAVSRFSECRDIIQAEARKVGINEASKKKIDGKFKIVSLHIIKKGVLLLCGIWSGWAVINAASLEWKCGIKLYAALLVGVLIAVTFYAYIYFMIIVLCIREVYNSEFANYTYIYPIATGIFEKYMRICSFGLILFWIIGFILILLSMMVFDMAAFFVIAVIGLLICGGYVFFTFYPYYLTRKKIYALKMQTIRRICKNNDLLEKSVFENNVDIIKYISESPNVMASNFHLILTSTLAAIASFVTPFLSFFK